MLRKVVVEEVGNTRFLYGQQVDKFEFQEENEHHRRQGRQARRGAGPSCSA